MGAGLTPDEIGSALSASAEPMSARELIAVSLIVLGIVLILIAYQRYKERIESIEKMEGRKDA